MLRWMKANMLIGNQFISPGDLDLVTVTDDPQQAIDIILEYERSVGPPEVVPKVLG